MKVNNRAQERARAVARFNQDHEPNWEIDSSLFSRLSRVTNFENNVVIFRKENIAMMHDMGDNGCTRFADEADCLEKIRNGLNGRSPRSGAVVVWAWKQIFWKRNVPETYCEALVHSAGGCTTFWIHHHDPQQQQMARPLSDLVGYADSFVG